MVVDTDNQSSLDALPIPNTSLGVCFHFLEVGILL